MYEELIERFKIRINSFGDMENEMYKIFKSGTNDTNSIQVRDLYSFMEVMEKLHQEVRM